MVHFPVTLVIGFLYNHLSDTPSMQPEKFCWDENLRNKLRGLLPCFQVIAKHHHEIFAEVVRFNEQKREIERGRKREALFLSLGAKSEK